MTRGLRGALLAAGSVMAVTMAMGAPAQAVTAKAACYVQTNPGLPYTQTGNTCVTFTATPAGSGDVTNNGTVTATGGAYPTATGVSITSGATVDGNVVNNGSITATNYGVSVNQGTLTGSIVNTETGTITANTGALSEAIYVQGPASSVGGIANYGTLNGGIFVTGSAAQGLVVGGITNSGTINAGIGAGNFSADITVSEATLTGDVSNAGTITASQSGILLASAKVDGDVSNSGQITATNGNGILLYNLASTGSGTYTGGPAIVGGKVSNTGTITANAGAAGILLSGAQVGGDVVNDVGGTINAASGAGILLTDNANVVFSGGTTVNVSSGPSSVQGGITNSGAINANIGIQVTDSSQVALDVTNALGGTINTSGEGIVVENSSTVSGSLVNAGIITSSETGIVVRNGATVGGQVSNTGTINSSGTGIAVYNSATVSGQISNTGTINSSNTGIAVYNGATISGGISNTGTINSGGTGISVYYSATVNGGGIYNSGTINSGGTGIGVFQGGTVNGDITNVGNINSRYSGIDIYRANVNGGITNQGAIVSRYDDGIDLDQATVTGSILNSGSIQSPGTGIEVYQSTVGGSITNSSSINASTGIGLYNAEVDGDVVNQGTITATGDYGVVAYNSTVTGSITNAAGATISSSSAAGAAIAVQQASVGAITNDGVLSGANGIEIEGTFGRGGGSSAVVNGDITNTGVISAALTGIVVGSAEVDGSIINSGQITAANGSGIKVINLSGTSGSFFSGSYGEVTGSIVNNGSITTSGKTSAGIYLAGAAVAGDVDNSGTINASDGVGIVLTTEAKVILPKGGTTTVATGPTLLAGAINNSGTINAQYGVVVDSGFVGAGVFFGGSGSLPVSDFGINNSGSINGAAGGVLITDNGLVFGGLTNSGSITGGTGAGVLVSNSSGLIGGVVNSGSISGVEGVMVSGSSSAIVGGIVNSGVISANDTAILLDGGRLVTGTGPFTSSGVGAGGIVNSGTITGARGIVLTDGATIEGPIVNSGNITGSTAAIDLTGEGSATTIDQEGGVITGDILLSPMADVLNVSGGTINGNIVGGGGDNSINFDLGAGVFDYKYAFTNVGQVTVNSGSVILEGADAPAAFAVNGGGVVVGNNAAFGAATVTMADGTALSFLNNASYDVANNFVLSGVVTIAPPNGTLDTLSGVLSDGGSPGEVRVTGGGVIDLTGNNTYSGGTLLTSGTLRVGVDTVQTGGAITSSALGTGAVTFAGGALQAGGAYTVDNAANVSSGGGTIDANGFAFTYAGSISGTGPLSIVNSGGAGGKVIFTSNNSYSGTATVGGVLQLGAGGAAGSVAGNIVDNGLVVFDRSDVSTYAGDISGTGAVQQVGSGTTILTGSSTFAGGTTISAGTLQIGAGGTSGSIGGAIVDNSVLAFDRSDASSYAGTISGSGELAKLGTGTLTLTGTSAVGSTVVEAGTLVLSGPLTSTFTIDNGATLQGSTTTILTSQAIADNGTLVFNQTSDGHFDTAIDGSGQLVKQGSGLLVLNGVSSVGSTVVNAGDLQIGDSTHLTAQLTSPTVQVNAPGVLSGHGTIVGSVTNAGTVAPGGTIGTLTINGNYTQVPSGVLSIEVTPTANSRLAVTGTANLAGTVVLVADPGSYRKGTTYNYLTAGSINGAFASVTATNGMLLGGPNLLIGTAVVESGIFSNSLSNANQAAIGGALVSVPVGASSDFDTIANALLALPDAQQNAALNQLGGEVTADLPLMGRDSARTFLGGIGEQLHTGGAGSDAAANGDPWGRAYGNFGSVRSDREAHGFDDTSGGVMLGASRAVAPNAVIGAAFDYEHTDVSLHGLPQSGQLNVWAGALYGEVVSGPFFADVAGSLGYDSNTTTRNVDFAGISRQAKGSFGGYTGAVMGTIGQRVPYGAGMVFEPSASLVYTHVHQNGFTENDGSGVDLTVGAHSQDALESILQAKVTKTIATTSGGVIRLSIKGGWAHEFDATRNVLDEAFAAGSSPFALAGAETGRNAGLFGASLSYDLSKRVSFFGRYDGAYGDLATNHAVSVGFNMTW